jgi:tellurite resistance protein
LNLGDGAEDPQRGAQCVFGQIRRIEHHRSNIEPAQRFIHLAGAVSERHEGGSDDDEHDDVEEIRQETG